MKDFCLRRTTNFITQYKDFTPQELEELQYGLEGLYLTLTKTIIILSVSYFLGILKETLIILVFFNFLRFTGFGFHANNSIQCLILSTILFSILPFIFLNVKITYWIEYFIIMISILTFLLYAPADTVKRPLTNKKKRTIRKYFTVLFASIYTVFIILYKENDISTLLSMSLLIEAIMVHPLTYRIFRQPYRNYKDYDV